MRSPAPNPLPVTLLPHLGDQSNSEKSTYSQLLELPFTFLADKWGKQKMPTHLNGARQVEVIRSEYTFWLLLNMHLPKGVWGSQIPGPGGRLFEVGVGWGEGAQRQSWQESLLIRLLGAKLWFSTS